MNNSLILFNENVGREQAFIHYTQTLPNNFNRSNYLVFLPEENQVIQQQISRLSSRDTIL
ncbi:hypothetical protein [Bacillus sp. 2205SS5-2]|uniref:hypothetical protein n=1 Tax=Bacillus sp. 2205SS5-2 TaxID=3109031 RepID=UPI0030067700